MNKNIFNISSLLILSSIIGCSNISSVNTLTPSQNTVVESNNSDNGTVLVDVSKFFNKDGFTTKSNFRDAAINQLKINVTGYNMAPVNKSIRWAPSTASLVPLSIPSGKNRIISITGMDNSGQPLARMLTYANVGQNFTSSVNIDYGTTAAARVLNNLLNSDDASLVPNIKPLVLMNLILNITNYEVKKATFRKTDPGKIDVNTIASTLVTNAGEIADVSFVTGLDKEIAPVNVQITVKDPAGKLLSKGVIVSANDISCNIPTNNNNGTYDVKVDQGIWEVEAKYFLLGSSIIIPKNEAERRSIIINGGKYFEAKKVIHIKEAEDQAVELVAAEAEVIY